MDKTVTTKLLVLIVLTLLMCNPILLGQGKAEDNYKTEKFLYVDFKTELLSPNVNTYYTDSMPLDFTVDWRRNESWVVWIVPIFSYSIDNGSKVKVNNDQFIQGGPYINWGENENEITITNDTIEISNLKDGIHTLTLYAEVSVAAGQLYGVNCTLINSEFRVGNKVPSQTDDSSQNPIQTQTIIAIVIIAVMVIAIVSVLLYRRHQKTANLSK